MSTLQEELGLGEPQAGEGCSAEQADRFRAEFAPPGRPPRQDNSGWVPATGRDLNQSRRRSSRPHPATGWNLHARNRCRTSGPGQRSGHVRLLTCFDNNVSSPAADQP